MVPTGSGARSVPEVWSVPPARVRVEREVSLRAELQAPVMERVLRRLERESVRVVALEGVRAFYAEGWLWVRPSATEPLCRIEAEGPTILAAESLAERGVTLIKELAAALGTSDGLSDLWCDSR